MNLDKLPLKSLSINGPESECIPSSNLVRMMLRAAEREEKAATITVGQVPPIPRQEGRAMKMIGKGLLVFASLYFLVHILIWAVKP